MSSADERDQMITTSINKAVAVIEELANQRAAKKVSDAAISAAAEKQKSQLAGLSPGQAAFARGLKLPQG